VSEANELLRALKQPAQSRPHEPSPPASEKTDARARALLPIVADGRARDRAALLLKAQARAAVGLAGGVLVVVVVAHDA
jgi:hypothetical protein